MNATQELVPGGALVSDDGGEVPAEGLADLVSQVEVGVVQADQGDAGPGLHRAGAPGVELDVDAGILDPTRPQDPGVALHSGVGPDPGGVDRPVELGHEVQDIFLLGVAAPDIRGMVFDAPLDAGRAGLAHIDGHQVEPVFGRELKVQEHARLGGFRKSVALETGARGRGQFHVDPGVGQKHLIVSDAGLLPRFVHSRAIAGVGLVLIAHLDLERPGRWHHQQSGHGPFVDVTEPTDVLDVRIVAGLPAGVLVVGAEFDHAKGHPGTGSDHPAGVCTPHHGVDVIRRRRQRVRGTEDGSRSQPPIAEVDGVMARYPGPVRICDSIHRRQGHLEHRTAELGNDRKNPFPIEKHGQFGRGFETFQVDQERLSSLSLVLEFVMGSRHLADEDRGRRGQPCSNGCLEPHLIEEQPAATNGGELDRVASRAQAPGFQGQSDLLFAPTRPGARQRSFTRAPRQFELGGSPVDDHLQQGRVGGVRIHQIDHQGSLAVSPRRCQVEQDREHLGPSPRQSARSGPLIRRSWQHVRPGGGGGGLADQEEAVFPTEIPLQKIPIAVRCQREFRRGIIRRTDGPEGFRRHNRRRQQPIQGDQQNQR